MTRTLTPLALLAACALLAGCATTPSDPSASGSPTAGATNGAANVLAQGKDRAVEVKVTDATVNATAANLTVTVHSLGTAERFFAGPGTVLHFRSGDVYPGGEVEVAPTATETLFLTFAAPSDAAVLSITFAYDGFDSGHHELSFTASGVRFRTVA